MTADYSGGCPYANGGACMAHDGHGSLTYQGECEGCGLRPGDVLKTLRGRRRPGDPRDKRAQADLLRDVVDEIRQSR